MKANGVDVYGVIYKITNNVNGKVYIGQTIQGFKKRYSNRWWHYTTNNYLKNSAEKYGISNFKVDEVFDIAFSKDELDEKEKYWIGYYQSNTIEKGYNLDSGGSNGVPNELARKKMSLKKQGEKNNRYGIKLSDEIKVRMRNSNIGVQRGEKHPLYGKNRPVEWREQHSERMKGEKHPAYGKYGSDNPKSKSVICLTTNKVFGSIKEAMSFYSIKNRGGISFCCKGKQDTSGKHPETGEPLKWMYYDEYITNKSAE